MSRPRGVLRAPAFLRKRERQQLPASFLPAQARGKQPVLAGQQPSSLAGAEVGQRSGGRRSRRVIEAAACGRPSSSSFPLPVQAGAEERLGEYP